MKKIFLMMGIPGGGKSTWIRSNLPSDAVVCSADHFFVNDDGIYIWKKELLHKAHRVCFDKYLAALDTSDVSCVVVDNTNTKRADMRQYVVEANNRGYDVNIVAITVDPEVAAQRNVHGVPNETIKKMYSQIQNTIKLGFPNDWKIASVIKVEN